MISEKIPLPADQKVYHSIQVFFGTKKTIEVELVKLSDLIIIYTLFPKNCTFSVNIKLNTRKSTLGSNYLH